MEVYAVSVFVMKELQALAEVHCAAIPKKAWKELNSVHTGIVESVVKFLKNYAGTYALRDRANPPPIFLPASAKKKVTFEQLCSSLLESGDGWVLGHSSFHPTCKHYTPEVQVMKPRTRICTLCDRLCKKICPCTVEEQMSGAREELRDHIFLAQTECDYYNASIEHSHSDDVTPSSHSHLWFCVAVRAPVPYPPGQSVVL